MLGIALTAVGCGDDAPADESLVHGEVAWCGPVTWTVPGRTTGASVDLDAACARVDLSVLDDAPWDGTEGDTRGRPTRVAWTLDLRDATGRTVAACHLRGEDPDGLDGGFEIVEMADASGCEVYAPTSFGFAADLTPSVRIEAATLALARDTRPFTWDVDIEAEVDVWGTDTDDLRFARIRERTPLTLAHAGVVRDDLPPDLTWPRRGSCFADGCWQVDYALPRFDAGGDDPSCTDVVAGLDAPTVIYLVRANGGLADNGLAEVAYTPLPVESCAMHAQDDMFWSTTLDHDAGIATVTYVGAGTPSTCRIVYEGPLAACR